MSSTKTTITTNSAADTTRLGELLASRLSGSDTIELMGDLGAGKTQLVRGLAAGVDSPDQVQSPSFMLQRVYDGQPYGIHHFDFYRLNEPGVMLDELRESLEDPDVLVAIEWAKSTRHILPDTTVSITIEPLGENSRRFTIKGIENIQEVVDDFND